MHRLNYCLSLAALAVFAVAITGCGEPTLDVQYVEGVVTVNGDPVEGATVMFTPVTPGEGVSATGMTDANGVYKLTAADVEGVQAAPGAGTTPGEYYIGVTKTVSPIPMSAEEAEEKGVPFVEPPPGSEPPPEYVVPQKYNNPKTSGVTGTVVDGKNDIPIKLEK